MSICSTAGPDPLETGTGPPRKRCLTINEWCEAYKTIRAFREAGIPHIGVIQGLPSHVGATAKRTNSQRKRREREAAQKWIKETLAKDKPKP